MKILVILLIVGFVIIFVKFFEICGLLFISCRCVICCCVEFSFGEFGRLLLIIFKVLKFEFKERFSGLGTLYGFKLLSVNGILGRDFIIDVKNFKLVFL